MIKMELTEDQKDVFEKVKAFMEDEETPALTISGSAGTGKTFLTKYIIDYIQNDKYLHIAGVAPTHKAAKVLEKTINTSNQLIQIPIYTVSSILGKIPQHSYIGSKTFKSNGDGKMACFDFFILDEVSMVCDRDLDKILDFVCEFDKKIILIGDNNQIPSPSQQVVLHGNVCRKPDSYAFEIEGSCTLNKIVRQAENSPIIKVATYIKNNIELDISLDDILLNTDLDLTITMKDMYKEYKEVYNSTEKSVRVITYTNNSVKTINKNIRNCLGYKNKLNEGELLMGYKNVGYPIVYIKNGMDYVVTKIRRTNTKIIGNYSSLSGYIVEIQEFDCVDKTPDIFFIDVNSQNNINFMKQLVHLAQKVNKRYSSKQDYRNYFSLKNRAIFIEDIYVYMNTVMSELAFKEKHPLLFTKVSSVINTETNTIIQNELTKKLEEHYGDIVEGRILDNKLYGDCEVFADQFMVVEKDIYYGYAITAHKSQGSTYKHVYVNDDDFNKIKDCWNFRLRCKEERIKEKNQLRYVAYTRPSEVLKLLK